MSSPVTLRSGDAATTLMTPTPPSAGVGVQGADLKTGHVLLLSGFGEAALLAQQNGFVGQRESVVQSQSVVQGDDTHARSEHSRVGEDSPGLLEPAPEVTATQSSTIPEPATLFLLGTGLFGAGFGARHLKDRAVARELQRQAALPGERP